VISPVAIFHIALASHWIILAALWRYFVPIDRDGYKKYSIYWMLIGFFSFGLSDSGLGGFGFFSFNLNALFNSLGTSRWLPGLELYDARQYEGYAYLGLGMLLIGVVAVGLFFGSLTKK